MYAKYTLYSALLPIILVMQTCTYYTPPQAQPHESYAASKHRFDVMTVRQIRHVKFEDLNPQERKAFKKLAASYFMKEVIKPGCSNQAHRRKYEIMYAKIGAYDALHTQKYS